MTASQVVADNRGRLFAIAYRMLGEIGEAEDAVQEAFVRWERNDGPVDNPEAWLTTVVSRVCVDRLRSASTAVRPTSGRGCPSRSRPTRPTPPTTRRSPTA